MMVRALSPWIRLTALALALALAAIAGPASAQDSGAKGKARTQQQAKPRSAVGSAQDSAGPPNALQGFSQNRDEPVRIRADSLIVHNKENTATFKGNVQFTQGDTMMQCTSLVVYYMSDGAKGSMPTGKGSQSIRKLDAQGGVHVVRKEETAQGETGVFDMTTHTATLQGNVVITRGSDVVRGQRLVVDLTTGVSRMEAGGYNGGGRVEGLFQAGSRPDASTVFSPRNSN
jgi:lipopolysaccharide export system protein LptA